MALTFSSDPSARTSQAPPTIAVRGAGVAGLTAAFTFARRGASVRVVERRASAGLGCSFVAGGMLAPWCESESADSKIRDLGLEALAFWTQDIPVATRSGSLVVAPARDAPDLRRFARLTARFERLDGEAIARLEPDFAGRFSSGLFFADEAHLEPRRAIAALIDALAAMPNVSLEFDAEDVSPRGVDWTIDARGLAAREQLTDLRGVKGEMVVLRSRDISLARPVRLLHPRHPVYIVPRPDNLFMVGATTVENEEAGRISARGLLELLGAAYTIHPAFGEAEVVETGCDLRPAFPDNVPRVIRDGRTLYINGLYRHGFLLAPALARQAAAIVFGDASELDDGHIRERHAVAG